MAGILMLIAFLRCALVPTPLPADFGRAVEETVDAVDVYNSAAPPVITFEEIPCMQTSRCDQVPPFFVS